MASVLKRRGLRYTRFAGSAFVRSGVPDFYIPKIHGWVEAKAPGRYPKGVVEGCKRDSPAQYKFLMDVQEDGANVLITDSLEAFEAWLTLLV